MPRQARIDAPGAFHHIICRGIERRRVFLDDVDRNNFVNRLGEVLHQTSTLCFAWSLLPNHFHILTQTGAVPLSTVMSRLLTGYAGDFNRRHNRHGHLFQNRYKSILCQEEPYFLELVRYIHLNPLRARVVKSVDELKKFRYCGHASLLGIYEHSWQKTKEVLLRFDKKIAFAKGKYESFVAEGVDLGKRPEFAGGGLVRSAGGWQKILGARRYGEYLMSDERILGDSDFVNDVLSAAQEKMKGTNLYSQNGIDLERVAQIVAGLLQMNLADVWKGGRKPNTVQARSLLCYWATSELGLTATAVGERLKLSSSAASRSSRRGEQIAKDGGWCLNQLILE
jgi:putative transposase